MRVVLGTCVRAFVFAFLCECLCVCLCERVCALVYVCVGACVYMFVCVWGGGWVWLAHKDKTKNRATEIYLTFANVIVHKNQK